MATAVSAEPLPQRFPPGTPILCDADPKIGTLLKWRTKSGKARVRLSPDDTSVDRDQNCLFQKSHASKKVYEFTRGSLLCKVYCHDLYGHASHQRMGRLYMQKWYQTWSTGYQGRHIGGECNYVIYCILVNGKLVYRPIEELELSAKFTETAGNPTSEDLCVL